MFSLWRALRRPTAPASRTKSRQTGEESRTRTKPVYYEHKSWLQGGSV
jgi:hypothetical protein